MISTATRTWLGWLAAAALTTSFGIGAETPAPRGGTAPTPTTTKSGAVQRPTTRSTTAKGPLPDPALLDGSAQTADKVSENGMLGEFEIPGDENVKNGKVGGGSQNPSPQGGAQDSAMPQQMGGGGGPQSPQSQEQAGGAAGAAGQQGGAQAGGPPDQAQAGGGAPIAGPADPNAAPQGIQVAELQGEPGQAGAPGAPGTGDASQKPGPVAIGDPAMQIKGIQNAPSVVGGQVAGQTQQMEKGIGGGAKGTTGNNNNRGAEKGRVMPAGL